MPPNKGGNSKKEAGRAKKEENENKKKSAANAKAEEKEAEAWSKGAKDSSKADKAKEKAAEAERKRAEKAALMKEEEASLPSKPKGAGAKKAGDKKKEPIRPAGPGALAAGGGLGAGTGGSGSSTPAEKKGTEPEPQVHIQATGLDNMLDALELVNAKADKASTGAQAGLIEKHPERRYKAAFEAYLEREMPILKVEHPGLRKNQMQDMLHKQFQKAPENPFNQVSVAYNATKGDKVAALQESRAEKERAFAGSPRG